MGLFGTVEHAQRQALPTDSFGQSTELIPPSLC